MGPILFDNLSCQYASQSSSSHRQEQSGDLKKMPRIVACVASVSVWFRSKKGTFGFDRAKNETRTKKLKRGEGKGKEGNASRQTPWFWKPAFASERSAWFARLVEQYWQVSMKGLFHTERSCMVRDTHLNFLRLLFILVGKIYPRKEHLNFIWNAKLFFRLYKGFRSFNLFSKVSSGSG